MDCDCIFHNIAIFTRVETDTSKWFQNVFRCVKIVGNDVVHTSWHTGIGNKGYFKKIEFQNTDKSVKQRFLEECDEMEQSYHRVMICFENAASLRIASESPTNLNVLVTEFIERMIDAYMPLGIINLSGLNDARNVLNEIYELLNSSYAFRSGPIIEKSNKFYEMIPHIELNSHQPKILLQINSLERYHNKVDLIDHIAAVANAIQTGRRMGNRNVIEYIYNDFMNVELNPILRDGVFTANFSIDDSQRIKFIFSMRKPHETADFEAENAIGNIAYLFHSTHLANLIDILREGLRVAPNHVFSYNRWYGRGIYFYGDFEAALNHASRLRHKIILVCRVALGNVKNCGRLYMGPNSLYELQSNENSLRAFGTQRRSMFRYSDIFRAFLPLKSIAVVEPLELASSTYGRDDEFLVQHENQVKIEYIIELN